jgi:hypothetical protein
MAPPPAPPAAAARAADLTGQPLAIAEQIIDAAWPTLYAETLRTTAAAFETFFQSVGHGNDPTFIIASLYAMADDTDPATSEQTGELA